MIDAGFKRRDNRETCDDCGALVSAQLLPVHECKSAAESTPSEPTMGAWAMLKFIQRVLETTSPTSQDKADAYHMCKKLRTIEWEATKAAESAEIAELRAMCCDLIGERVKRDASSGCQPIATAPNDDTIIFVGACNPYYPAVTRCYAKCAAALGWQYWMPIPPLPKEEA